MELILITILGLIVGSFLSVCAYRIPLGHVNLPQEDDADCCESCCCGNSAESATAKAALTDKDIKIYFPPRSFCPRCKKQLLWWHNIPFFSWLFMGGRCAFCKERISLRYPLLEVATAFFAFLSYTNFGATATALIVFIFTCSLLVITLIDYDYYIIPNVITYPATILGLLIAVINHSTNVFTVPIVPNIWESLLGIATGAGFLLIVSELYFRVRKIDGLGMGDVKLLAMTGALFGAPCALYTIFIGSLLGSVIGIALVVFFRRKMSQMLPFGPFLATATLIYIYYIVPTQGPLFAIELFNQISGNAY